MPSRSNKQARFMAMLAHNSEKAIQAGVKQSVAKKFNRADAKSGRLSKAMRARGN